MIYYCCANVPLCPIELRMSKTHQGVSNCLKVSLELTFFGKQQFALNRFTCFMTKSLKKFFLERSFFDFCRLFEVFHHQWSGLWIWALAIEWQTFSTLILKGFIVKHIICVQYQRNLCKQNLNCRKCILLMNGKMMNKIFLWTKFNCVSSLIFLGHPLV